MLRQFSSGRNRRCPRCGVDMESRQLTREVRVEVCLKCQGMWLDHGRLRSLVSVPISERSNPRDLLRAGPTEDPCPDCDLLLREREFPRGSGIFVAQCRRCAGMFMKKGVLDRIQEYLRRGRQGQL